MTDTQINRGINNYSLSFAPDPPKFKVTSPINEIFEAFKNPVNGVPFFEPLPSMPSLAFSSYDAIMWIYNRVEGVTNPIEILEQMHEKNFIAHASGDKKIPIIPGFFMYYIVNQDPNSAEYRPPLGDIEAFTFEWMEVEIPLYYILPNYNAELKDRSENEVPAFLRDAIISKQIDGKLYKNAHLEVDIMQKVIDRVEFGHARYHKHYIPTNAFELVVQWVAASGPIIYDLVRFKPLFTSKVN